MVNIFIYNVIYIKCDISKLRYQEDQKMILIASPYCLDAISEKNRSCFDEIHPISRDFQKVNFDEIEKIVLHYIKEYGADNIRLLTNEDSTQLVCAHLREKYGIKGNTSDVLLPFVNKIVSKDCLENVVRMPKYTQFDKQAYLTDKEAYILSLESYLGYPMFIKPVDLVSSVETHRIPDKQTLIHVAEHIVRHDYDFEIDEFIDGELFHCDAMIIDGDIQFFMVGKCSFALSRFFEGKPVGSIPIQDENMFNQLKEFNKKVYDKLSCPSGAYHLEAFLDRKTGEFVFLEIGARTGGALITNVYEKLFNLNIEETNYLIQMGQLKKLDVAQKDLYAGFLNFPKTRGCVSSIIKPVLDMDSEFIEFVKPEDTLEQATNLLDIACSIIFWDQSHQKIHDTFEYLKNYNPLQLQQVHS